MFHNNCCDFLLQLLLHIYKYCDPYKHRQICQLLKLAGQWQWMSSTLAGQFTWTMCIATHLKPTLLCAYVFLHNSCDYLPYALIKQMFKRLVWSPMTNWQLKESILHWIWNKKNLRNQKTCFNDTKSKMVGLGKSTMYILKQQKEQVPEF
jgi:hypothetical protein